MYGCSLTNNYPFMLARTIYDGMHQFSWRPRVGGSARGCHRHSRRVLIPMLDITERRVLQQMIKQAADIVPNGNQDLDAFGDAFWPFLN
jgi:hypothetical protein